MSHLEKPSLQHIPVQMFPDGRLDAKNAALYLGFKDKTLAIMRGNGSGPKFIKKGRVFYYKEDLEDWINQGGRFSNTTQLQFSKSQSKNLAGKNA